MRFRARRGESGFSLTEMTIAIAITLLITGAVYGLLSAGDSAFKREPELIDRQQNIRTAMDLIMRDTLTGGEGMGPWTQVFTNNLNGAGPLSPGSNADILEVVGNDGSCGDAWANTTTPVAYPVLNLVQTIPTCYTDNAIAVVVFGAPGYPPGTPVGTSGAAPTEVSSKYGFMAAGGTASASFVAANNGGTQIKAAADLNTWMTAPATSPYNTKPIKLSHGNVFRYEIANDTDGVPSLWRSTSGGQTLGVYAAPSNAAAAWQLVARGIEDFQVQYRTGASGAAWLDNPGAVSCGANCTSPGLPPAATPEYDTIVREVKITLQARAATLGKGTDVVMGTAGPTVRATRGQLTSVTTPRAALYYLQMAQNNNGFSIYR